MVVSFCLEASLSSFSSSFFETSLLHSTPLPFRAAAPSAPPLPSFQLRGRQRERQLQLRRRREGPRRCPRRPRPCPRWPAPALEPEERGPSLRFGFGFAAQQLEPAQLLPPRPGSLPLRGPPRWEGRLLLAAAEEELLLLPRAAPVGQERQRGLLLRELDALLLLGQRQRRFVDWRCRTRESPEPEQQELPRRLAPLGASSSSGLLLLLGLLLP